MKLPIKIALISFLTFLGLYTAFMLAYFPTSETSFCKNCHLVEPYVLSWENEPHHDVKCLFCHEQRGFLGKMESKARGLNYLYLSATNQDSPIIPGAKIFESNCVDCHMNSNKEYPEVEKLDQDHLNYLKEDKSCLNCHKNTGHDVNLFYP